MGGREEAEEAASRSWSCADASKAILKCEEQIEYVRRHLECLSRILEIYARRGNNVEVSCCCLEMARQAEADEARRSASSESGLAPAQGLSHRNFGRDAVDQALNATTALFDFSTTKTVFQYLVSDTKISGWLSHKQQEILAMPPSR